jgi:hypothetical protein
MTTYKRYIRELLEAIGIACLFASPFIVYFMDMKP